MKIAAPILALIPQFGARGQADGRRRRDRLRRDPAVEGAPSTPATARRRSPTRSRAAPSGPRKMAGYYRRAEDYVLPGQRGHQRAGAVRPPDRGVAAARAGPRSASTRTSSARSRTPRRSRRFLARQVHARPSCTAGCRASSRQTHYECYKLAFDVAKRAEQTLAHELMRPEFDDMRIIQFGYWDAGRKGLLAGEQLGLDLRRLETGLPRARPPRVRADQARLARPPRPAGPATAAGHRPLRVRGPRVAVRHGQRRTSTCGGIKTVAVSIPAVTGPYTSIHAKLSLLRSSIRTSSLLGDQYAASRRRRGRPVPRLHRRHPVDRDQLRPTTTAGCSSSTCDDERRLPFEGAGRDQHVAHRDPERHPAVRPRDASPTSCCTCATRPARPATCAAQRSPTSSDDVLVDPDTLERLFSLPDDFRPSLGGVRARRRTTPRAR